MFGIIPRPMWMKVAPPDESNRILLALRLWLIQSGARLILVDTGIGDYHDPKFGQRFDIQGASSPLERTLEKIGFTAGQVTNVVLSHLHFDHAGGIATHSASGAWAATFPQALHHIHRQHYKYALSPTMKDGGSFHTQVFRPVIEELERQGKVQWHDGVEGELIADAGLKFKTSQGHTPYLMHPYDDRFIYLADLVPTAHHIHLPWVMAYDMQPGVSATEKHAMFEFIGQHQLTIIFEHDPESWGSTIALQNGHYVADVKRPALGREGQAYAI